MAGNPDNVRLGHALRMSNEAWAKQDLTEITKEAFRYATGQEQLRARAPAPQFKTAVEHAEEQIGINPHDPDRPVYAYVGDLHAGLGQVGLVFDRNWARRCLHGFTQCDSGGMVGGYGNFHYTASSDGAGSKSRDQMLAAEQRVNEAWQTKSAVQQPAEPETLRIAEEQLESAKKHMETVRVETRDDRDLAVRSITVLLATDPGVVATLDAAFAAEVKGSYPGGARDYVDSVKPNSETWDQAHHELRSKNNLQGKSFVGDPRRVCLVGVDAKHEAHDRRLWTWEVRMSGSPRADELRAVILSSEAGKVFLTERMDKKLRDLAVDASLRDVQSPSSVVTVQIGAEADAELHDVELVIAGPNPTTQKQSGKENDTKSAPWFYSDRAREVLLGPP